MARQLLFLPGPVMVSQAVSDALARPLIDHRGPEFAQLLRRVSGAVRPVFGTQSDIVLLGSSGTGAMEAAIANVLSHGDRVLSCPVGVFGKRFGAIARSYGCIVESLETPVGAALDPGALQARLAADTRREIAAVLLTHNETSTGVANDMAALAPVLRKHGALTLVDSISGLGASEFRMDEWGYDVVVAASQKAFAAPPGVAMAAMSARAWARLERVKLPRFYFDFQRARDAARDGQTPWTPPVPILFALDVALDRYHTEGMANAHVRHAQRAAMVRAALQQAGFTLVSRHDAHSPTVVAAYPPAGIEPKPLLSALREKHGIVLASGQGELSGRIVRFGTMGDVDESDIARALAAIELELRAISDAA